MADLTVVAATNLGEALTSGAGKNADVMVRNGMLRQTVIAPRERTRLSVHNSPPAAPLQVLVSKVRVEIDESQQGMFSAKETWALTRERHSVSVLEGVVFLLTTAMSTGEGPHS